MDIHAFKRDPAYVKKYMEKKNDKSIVFTKPAMVMIPRRWTDSDLATMGNPSTILAICAIIIDNRYAVSSINSLISTDSFSVSYDFVDNEEYIVIAYRPQDRFIINASLVKRDNLPYKIFTFIFDKGRIPWYIDYENVAQIFDSAAVFANVKFNLPHFAFEAVAGSIARNAKAKNTYYRHGDWKVPPVYIPLRSVQFAASNTTAKLIGAYWSEGLSSALVYPSERKEVIEDLLRS